MIGLPTETDEDVLAIADCDLFLYIGGESDAWVLDILESFGEDAPRALRRQEDRPESVPWRFALRVDVEKAEGWQEIALPEPICAKYLRFVLVDNHNSASTPESARGWTELSEIKIYP